MLDWFQLNSADSSDSANLIQNKENENVPIIYILLVVGQPQVTRGHSVNMQKG